MTRISSNFGYYSIITHPNIIAKERKRVMAKIQIVIGSVTGTAEGVADFIKDELDSEHTIDTNVDTTVDDLVRDDGELLLFCTSNTGCGDLPDNIYPLYEDLRETPPKIAGRKYALINIGDSSFPTFGEAGVALDEALKDIGAEPLAESLLIDVGEERYPQKIALEWVKSIL
ncbi:MAG: flavodoxin domain-containing protein [Pseudomonadota bacterium]